MPFEYTILAPALAAHPASVALQSEAGEFAPAIARVFPRPHAPFFEADLPRRRLMCVLAARATTPEAAQALARPLAGWSARRLIEAFLPEAPAGFLEALKRLEGGPWTSQHFGLLLALLAEGGEGAKAVRHAPSIRPDDLRALAALPDLLRTRAIAGLLNGIGEARLVSEAWRAALGEDPTAADKKRLAATLERAKTRRALFSRLVDAIGERQIGSGLVPGSNWLKPILGPKAMSSAAVRHQNCLRDRIPLELSGAAAYYELLGAEAGVIEIVRDRKSGSWRFGEMRGTGNAPLSRDTLKRVEAHLMSHGVRPWGKAGRLVQELGWAMAE